MFDSVLDFIANGLLDWSGWQITAFTLIATHITIAGVTIYLHRSQAHRALDLHPIVSHFFRFWLWMTTGMVTREWVAIHRKHHARCETPEDPHSPQTRGIDTVLLTGAELYRAEAKNQETIEKFSHGTPNDWIENNVYRRYSAGGVSIMLILDVLMFGGAGLTVWAVQMLWIPITAAGIINGIGHYWGYRNFSAPDASTNIFPIGIIIGGEELHNNHHTYASSARLSNKWYEFDIGWMYIKLMSYVGLATIRRVAPKPKFVAPRAHIDLESLNAVVNNRYEVLATYAKSLRAALAQEKDRLAGVQSVNLSKLKRWVQMDAAKLDASEREKLGEALAHSKSLATLYEMRQELAKLWERSNRTTEQLVADLQAWCAKAEVSGVKALEDFAVKLRTYA
ncbi:DesA family fatty acid desaturase [Derxia lacustris]|uniref:DesA family fatty acid desaturase n=1 Tax=Derxia lacustris TaxID=764842 RepID=UPI000A173A82|nr:fatty acid desaturase [Derxia lacustris]